MGGFKRKLLMWLTVGNRLRFDGINKWIVEEAGEKFQSQRPRECPVNEAL